MIVVFVFCIMITCCVFGWGVLGALAFCLLLVCGCGCLLWCVCVVFEFVLGWLWILWRWWLLFIAWFGCLLGLRCLAGYLLWCVYWLVDLLVCVISCLIVGCGFNLCVAYCCRFTCCLAVGCCFGLGLFVFVCGLGACCGFVWCIYAFGGCWWRVGGVFGLLLFKCVVWFCLIFTWLFYCDLLVCFVYDWLLCGGDDVALALLLSRSAFNWLGLLLIVIGWFSSWVCWCGVCDLLCCFRCMLRMNVVWLIVSLIGCCFVLACIVFVFSDCFGLLWFCGLDLVGFWLLLVSFVILMLR